MRSIGTLSDHLFTALSHFNALPFQSFKKNTLSFVIVLDLELLEVFCNNKVKTIN